MWAGALWYSSPESKGRWCSSPARSSLATRRKRRRKYRQVGPAHVSVRAGLSGTAEDRVSAALDGKRLAYLANSEANVLNVWVKTLGKDDDRMVTNDLKRGIRMFGWAENDTHLFYFQVCSRQAHE